MHKSSDIHPEFHLLKYASQKRNKLRKSSIVNTLSLLRTDKHVDIHLVRADQILVRENITSGKRSYLVFARLKGGGGL